MFVIVFSIFQTTYSAGLDPEILLTWSVLNSWSWWKLVFPNDALNGVKIITSWYDLVNWTWDFKIKWNFWLKELSSTNSGSFWWVSFDIWNNIFFNWSTWPKVSPVILKNLWTNKFRFEWYAWSNTSGWIYFWDTWITWSWSVIYDRALWKINWCWRSQNIWWVCISNITLNTTITEIPSPEIQALDIKPFAATDSKSLTLPSSIKSIIIDKWDGNTKEYDTSSFSHDFRKAKDYKYKLTDFSWSTSEEFVITVVSNVPSETLDTNNIWVSDATEINTWWTGSVVWDWNQSHNVNITLRDTYWNIINNKTWIKNVVVEIWFENTVDKDQVTNNNSWDAITYESDDFWNISWNTWTWYQVDGIYNVNIKSYAPTKEWYIYTTDNNRIKINKLKVTVESLSWSLDWTIWDWISGFIIPENYLKFSPAVRVTNITNSTSSEFIKDVETTFTWTININKTWVESIGNIKIHHKLDVLSWALINNSNISFQDIEKTNLETSCVWYLVPAPTNIYNTGSIICYPNTSSNILKTNTSVFTSSGSYADWFKATPKVVIEWINNFDMGYSSTVQYEISGSTIKYDSFERTIPNTYIPEMPSWEIKPFATTHNKSLTLPSDIAKIEVENWDTTAKMTYTTSSFSHDFRKAKDYEYILTDIYWNESVPMKVTVVSNVPSKTLDANNIWWWLTHATEINTSLANSIIWDWEQSHNIKITLRDTYWNIIKNEDLIKNVEVEISLINTVDKDQVANSDDWDAIRYKNDNDFWLNWLTHNTWTWYKSDGIYNVNIQSYAPTTEWYDYTTVNNDIKIDKLKVTVTSLSWSLTSVWEWTVEFTPPEGKFKFTPAVRVTNLTNDTDFNLSRDIETTFTWTISVNKGLNSWIIKNINIHHKLDVLSWSIIKNYYMSFQDIQETNWAKSCIWYIKPNLDNTDFTYDYTDAKCYPFTETYSNILKIYNSDFNTSQTFDDWFKTTLKMVLAWINIFDIAYNSTIEYDIWLEKIKYNSYKNDYKNLTNNQIKIAWIVNQTEKDSWIISSDNITYVWNLSKTELLNQVKINANAYKKIWNKIVDWVSYNTGNYLLENWPTWVNTIIVDWANLTITKDISKVPWQVKTIIVLKNDDSTKWDIYIKDNVQYIWATLITFKSIISWDSIVYYTDTWYAKNQLFIKWTIVSYNTIWSSSLAIPKCPYYIKNGCNFQTAKRYDLNNFRSYNTHNWWTSLWWYPSVDLDKKWYKDAPIIIEYDSDIQKNPPKILINNK